MRVIEMDQGMARLNGRLSSCSVLFCVLIVATSLAGCSSGSKSTTSNPSTTPATANESPVCAAGPLHIIGSTAFMPIAQDAAKAYMTDCPGAIITVTGGDSDYGLTQVRDAVASGSPSAGSMIAMYDGLPSGTAGLSPYPMGVLIESVVAHTGLFPSGNITTAELKKIFVKPGERGKVAVGRRAGSGTRRAFIMDILGSNPGPPDKGNCPPPSGNPASFTSCTEGSTGDLLNFVNRTPNAIGYAVVSQLRASYPQVSVLSINSFAATPDNVRNETYKFWTVENLYASTKPTALTRDFLDFLSHYKGSSLPSYFIPCYAAPQKLGTDC
jgi:phosphate transport system substrate-binding protein